MASVSTREDGGRDVDRDALLYALADERRRLALLCLYSDGALPLNDLAAGVVGYENDVSVTRSPAGAARRVAIDLYHHHVPLLAEAGLVEHDRRSGVVSLTALGRDLEPQLYGFLADDGTLLPGE